MSKDISDQFDALVAGLEDEFAAARATRTRLRTRRFFTRLTIGVLLVSWLGLQQPLLGAAAFLGLLAVLQRTLR